ASPHRVYPHLKQKNIPFYAISGWYDGAYAHSAIKKFLNWNPELARLTLGPWDHGGHQLIGPYAKKKKPDFPFMQEIIRFFDIHLKRMSGESDDKYKVSYYTIGYESWRFSDVWPPESLTREYFLSENSQLLFYKSANADSKKYITGPSTRTGKNSRWDSLFNPFKKRIHYPDRKKARSDCLSFDSQTLTEDIILTGSAEADLFISSDRPYGDIFVYLDEITEHGKIHYITEGILRMNFYSSKIKETETVFTHRSFLSSEWKEIIPGQVIRTKIHLLPVSYRLKKGSKISLSIAGADSDHFENNYSGKYPVYTIYFSGRYKSRILLPLEKNL
ncbi:MAG TPA: CocE/NonD family hydrolase, partial [Leptospiraceae bacterium]|nr:CocE/NonD family hydrolase [Leptospiraceae bacterium]